MPSDFILQSFIDADQLQQRVVQLGQLISHDYHQKDLHLVCVLKGALFFTVDLIRSLTIPITLHCVQASSYRNQAISSGNVHLQHDLNLEGKDLLVIEDILDSGQTLEKILVDFQSQSLASLEICTLLSKDRPRENSINPRYIGFSIPDKFVVGYGLDYAERYRELPYLAQVHFKD